MDFGIGEVFAWWYSGACWVGVGSGRCDAVLGGSDGIGREENPGPLALIEGAADRVGCEGGSK